MDIMTYSKSINGNTNISSNFKINEFSCKDGADEILIDMDMIPVLQYLRENLGLCTINSAYRTKSHNKSVGGATNSYHLKGMAFDIVIKDKLDEICKICSTLNVGGIIRYSNFVHLDNRPYAVKYHFSNINNCYTNYEKIKLPYKEILRKGSKNISVGILQYKLKTLGLYSNRCDSDFGFYTEQAVIKYQQKMKLEVDGIVGPKTWTSLFS